MWKTPLPWKAELCIARNSAFRAQLGNLITYHVVSEVNGYPAYVEVRGPRGGLKRLDLGFYVTMDQAKRACEQHCAAGCDLTRRRGLLSLEGMRGLASLDRRMKHAPSPRTGGLPF